MATTSNPVSSLVERTQTFDVGAHVVFGAFVGDTAAFALSDGALHLRSGERATRVAAHPEGGILCAVADRERILTAGDDGHIVATDASGATRVLGAATGWVDAIVTREDGAIAWACGKNVSARDAKGVVKTLATPSTARGLAFMPKGYRLAVAHYNGVSLWFPNTAAAPEALAWKGSHIDVMVSPDGRFVVSSMQENALAWLAAVGRPRHAHVRLPRQDALVVLVERRGMARDLGRGRVHRLALRDERRTDGARPEGAWACAAPASPPSHAIPVTRSRRDRLRGRIRPAGAARGRSGNPRADDQRWRDRRDRLGPERWDAFCLGRTTARRGS